VLLGAAVLLAGCATKPNKEALASLELYGADGAWSGLLTRRALTVRLPDSPEVAIPNAGWPCEPERQACFFGDVGGSRYVNWRGEAGRLYSLVADREPCGQARRGRPHPYKVRLYFHRKGESSDRILEGCAGPWKNRRAGR
jgi:hypothetical protein